MSMIIEIKVKTFFLNKDMWSFNDKFFKSMSFMLTPSDLVEMFKYLEKSIYSSFSISYTVVNKVIRYTKSITMYLISKNIRLFYNNFWDLAIA